MARRILGRRVRGVAVTALDSIEVVRRGAVRRAKLYYLRGRRGKSARIAERRDTRRDEAKKAESTEA